MNKRVKIPTIPSYESDEKQAFHRFWKKHLKQFATKHLGLNKKEFDVRSNLSGHGVGGEITLHTDNVYITVLSSFVIENNNILYRSCNGRKDYTGGSNHYTGQEMLIQSPERFVEILKSYT